MLEILLIIILLPIAAITITIATVFTASVLIGVWMGIIEAVRRKKANAKKRRID
jgi:hypothetical protein